MRQVKRTQFGYEGTHIEATCDPRLADREVCLSPITLEQPLINLIDNALHHVGDHDWGRVEVEARFVDSDAKTPIHIVVRDNGAGISAKGRDSMFEPRETSKGEKGVGMGLYASRNIVRAAGGTLECTEALMWACAEFKIRLPVLLGPSFDELTQ
jgi:C4-dicarboxylate-specific signal transduction histidine kinase